MENYNTLEDTENEKLSPFYQKIKNDYDEAMRDLRDGKLKGYSSTEEMWADLEAEGYI
ncbi:MAG: hypothetical protein LBM41_06030 [Ruminococcus sp.]|nr:hypothetical protein [Ruminococcus sp.]